MLINFEQRINDNLIIYERKIEENEENIYKIITFI